MPPLRVGDRFLRVLGGKKAVKVCGARAGWKNVSLFEKEVAGKIKREVGGKGHA